MGPEFCVGCIAGVGCRESRPNKSKPDEDDVEGVMTSAACESNPSKSSVSVKDFDCGKEGATEGLTGESPSSSDSNLRSLSPPLAAGGTGAILGTEEDEEWEEEEEEEEEEEDGAEGAVAAGREDAPEEEKEEVDTRSSLVTLAKIAPSERGTWALVSTASSQTFVSPI